MNESENYERFPGFHEELERIRTLRKEALMLGNEKEAERLLVEDFYELLFNQDQYRRQLYRVVRGIYEKHYEQHPEEALKIVERWLSNLEQEIIKSGELLNKWGNNSLENFKMLEQTYLHTPKENTEENK